MYPARSSRRWLGAPASAGSSRSVGMYILDQRMVRDSHSQASPSKARSLSPPDSKRRAVSGWLAAGQRRQVGQAADVRVIVGGRAEAEGVHVDRLQSRGQGAGHVVPQAVPDMEDVRSSWHVQGLERDGEDGRVGL